MITYRIDAIISGFSQLSCANLSLASPGGPRSRTIQAGLKYTDVYTNVFLFSNCTRSLGLTHDRQEFLQEVSMWYTEIL